MNLFKKSLIVIALTVALTLIFGSCGGDEHCSHRDKDDDSLCDLCGVAYQDGNESSGNNTSGGNSGESSNNNTSGGGFTGGNGSSENSSNSDDYSDDGVVYLISTDGTYAEVVDYTGSSKMVRIAESYEGVPVTSVGTAAFANKEITSVIIPDSVTSIACGAFSWCNSLTSITLPFIGANELSNNAHHLGYIFGDTGIFVSNSEVPTSLETVIITKTSSIGDYAFRGCRRIKNIVIPDSVSIIGRDAFEDCDNLIEEESGVFYVGKWVVGFDDSTAIVSVREGTVGIAEESFSYTEKLRSLALPDSITYICDNALLECSGLQYNLYNNGYYLGNGNNPYLALVKLKDNTISEFSIYANAKFILSSAFSGCINLTSIAIPNSITSISASAFSGCTNLTSISIPDGISSIGWRTFYGCTNLTSITLPDSVTSIGGDAFYGCTNLTSITLPDSITSIGDRAFYYCSSLASITIPNSVISIGDSAFRWCGSLMSVTIGDSVTRIGTWAFSSCSNLASIIIPISVNRIGSRAFQWCDSLTIKIEAESMPLDWASDWNFTGCPVVWGYIE